MKNSLTFKFLGTAILLLSFMLNSHISVAQKNDDRKANADKLLSLEQEKVSSDRIQINLQAMEFDESTDLEEPADLQNENVRKTHFEKDKIESLLANNKEVFMKCTRELVDLFTKASISGIDYNETFIAFCNEIEISKTIQDGVLHFDESSLLDMMRILVNKSTVETGLVDYKKLLILKF